MSKVGLSALRLFLIIVVLFSHQAETAQRKISAVSRVAKIEHEVELLSGKIKTLEARISAFEILSTTHSSNEQMRQGWIQASRDALINDMNNLAANAYAYRIRPASMGGGKGSYVGYKIPSKLATNVNGQYEAIVTSDSVVIFIGTSRRKQGSVKAVMGSRYGQLGSFEYTGEFP